MEKQIYINKVFNPYDLNDVANIEVIIHSMTMKDDCKNSDSNRNEERSKSGFFREDTEKK